jgi:hypothetical protein
MILHPSGGYAYVKVKMKQISPSLDLEERIQVFDIAAQTFLGGSEIAFTTNDRVETLAIRPNGSSGFLGRGDNSSGIAYLTSMDFTSPAAPTVGTSFGMGTFFDVTVDLDLALSPDGAMLYVRGSGSGEEQGSGGRPANFLMKGFDITGASPVLFDECYLGSTDLFQAQIIHWLAQGDRFLAIVPGITDPASPVRQDGLVHSFRVFPAGAQADLPPFKGGPSGGPLSNSTLTVFCYDAVTEMPSSGVNVSLSNDAGAVTATATTDASGNAMFNNLTGPQNVTIAPVGKANFTIFRVDAQSIKFPVFPPEIVGASEEPKITVVMNGIPGGPEYVQGIESSISSDNGGNFPTATDNIRTASLSSNERFSIGLSLGSGTKRARREFARAAPEARLFWNATLTAETNTHTLAGNLNFPSDVPNGATGNMSGAVRLNYSAEQGNAGSAMQNGGPNGMTGVNPQPYSGQGYFAPVTGVSSIQWGVGFPSGGGMTLVAGYDQRVVDQDADYQSWLNLPGGANPPASLSNQDFNFLNAPFFQTIGGTAVTGSGGFFITDPTPTIVVRDTVGPAGATGLYGFFLGQARPGGTQKVWQFFISSTDSVRVAGSQVTFTIPDLPPAVSSETFTSSNNRLVELNAAAEDHGAGFDFNSWSFGNVSGESNGQLLRRSGCQLRYVQGIVMGTLANGANMQQARYNFGAVKLASDNVFYAGGNTGSGNTSTGEIYNVSANTTDWTRDTSLVQTTMSVPRNEVPAVLLLDGRVALLSGQNAGVYQPTADIFDPTTGLYSTSTTPNMQVGRIGHAAVLLNDGRVLVVGGIAGPGGSNTTVPELEIYDPSTNNFSTYNVGGSITPDIARDGPNAVVLNPGGGSPTNVLVTGGRKATSGFDFNTAQVSNTAHIITVPNGGAPTIGAAITMQSARIGHAAVRLATGDVLLFGGVTAENPVETALGTTASVEKFNSGSQTFSAMTSALTSRHSMTASLTSVLGTPKVLIAGGQEVFGPGDQNMAKDIELYDPATGASDTAAISPVKRSGARAIVVPRPGSPTVDRIVILGGRDDQDNALNAIQYFDPN